MTTEVENQDNNTKRENDYGSHNSNTAQNQSHCKGRFEKIVKYSFLKYSLHPIRKENFFSGDILCEKNLHCPNFIYTVP